MLKILWWFFTFLHHIKERCQKGGREGGWEGGREEGREAGREGEREREGGRF